MVKILVVIDPQKDFIDGALGNPDAMRAVEPIAEKIREWHGPIFMTKDIHDPYLYELKVEGQRVPVHCMRDTVGAAFHPKIEKAMENSWVSIVEKDSFACMNLRQRIEDLMWDQTIESITLVGYCTDSCVISNALMLRGMYPKAKIIIDAKCCAGSTPEMHEAALKIMKNCCIDVINE